MKILDCKELRDSLLESIKNESEKLFPSFPPTLAIIRVGEDRASESYIKSKRKACKVVTFNEKEFIFGENSREEDVINKIKELNKDEYTDGILVQLPLPKGFDELKIINTISPEKDVDCFTKENVGALLQGGGNIFPCTPNGIIHIIKHFNIDVKGKNVVIINRSNIVGKPLSALLMNKNYNASVTVLNSFTENVKDYTKRADVLISAVGKPNFINSSFLHDGEVVIDVGINRIIDPSQKKGYKVVGDVDRESVEGLDISLTPVPGGVGLMTVTSLMENLLTLTKRRRG